MPNATTFLGQKTQRARPVEGALHPHTPLARQEGLESQFPWPPSQSPSLQHQATSLNYLQLWLSLA